MTRPSIPGPALSREAVAVVASGVVLVAGLVVLIGWQTDANWLKRALLPGVVVKANAGLDLILIGLASALTASGERHRRRQGLALALAMTAGVVAILTLAEYSLGADFRIDNLLFRESPGAPETAAAGRMALGAAIGLTLIAAAVASLALARGRTWIPTTLASVVATLAAMSILGRLYGSTELTGLGSGTQIAPGTAAALGLLAVAVVANPSTRGPSDILWSASPGGRGARIFALASLTILPGLALAGNAGVSAGWFGIGFEISLVVAVGAALLAIVGIVTANRLERLAGEIQQSSETMKGILDASPAGIIVLDGDLRVTYWSRGAERLYGWTASEVVGGPAPHLPGDDGPILADQLALFRSGQTLLRQETQRMSKSGEPIDVAISVVPLHDANGQLTGLLTVQEDIRERKRLEAALAEAHRLQTVGRLAGGIAHHFNNLLTVIAGHLELVLLEPLAPVVRNDLEIVQTTAGHAAGLTRQMLAFGRQQILRPEVMDVTELLRGVEAPVREILGHDVELVLPTDAYAGECLVDRAQMERAILNLTMNARDAMPDGGRLLIRAYMSRLGEADLPSPGMVPGDYVTISLTDTGRGMDPATRARIFEPFFTTKGIGEGTGLGLSTTYGIVKQLGGDLAVSSSPGRGSTFSLYFPSIGLPPTVVQ